jgi:hypothetical protein
VGPVTKRYGNSSKTVLAAACRHFYLHGHISFHTFLAHLAGFNPAAYHHSWWYSGSDMHMGYALWGAFLGDRSPMMLPNKALELIGEQLMMMERDSAVCWN